MNGGANREMYGSNAGRGSPPQGSPPSIVRIPGKTLVEGYRKDILNGFEKENPRYNPVSSGHVPLRRFPSLGCRGCG